MMLWQRLHEKLISAGLEQSGAIDSRPLLYIDSRQQLLCQLSAQDEVVQYYPISTSRYGLGEQQGSFKTPRGIHRVAQKIGDSEPLGRVFKARVATDQICLAEDFEGEEDVISSRILWLEGLQPGFNRGAEVDTLQRYIYIHGTADEVHIGQPASIGCIRMRNLDVIRLFDQVQLGDWVIIE